MQVHKEHVVCQQNPLVQDFYHRDHDSHDNLAIENTHIRIPLSWLLCIAWCLYTLDNGAPFVLCFAGDIALHFLFFDHPIWNEGCPAMFPPLWSGRLLRWIQSQIPLRGIDWTLDWHMSTSATPSHQIGVQRDIALAFPNWSQIHCHPLPYTDPFLYPFYHFRHDLLGFHRTQSFHHLM